MATCQLLKRAQLVPLARREHPGRTLRPLPGPRGNQHGRNGAPSNASPRAYLTVSAQNYSPYAGLLPDYRGQDLPASARSVRASPRDWIAKVRACRAYSSQLPLFGRAPLARMLAYELRERGERVAWID